MNLEDKQDAMLERQTFTKPDAVCKPYAVYVMRAGEFAKIGYSKNVVHRRAAIQHACPLDVQLVKVYSVPDQSAAMRLEHAMHCACADLRLRNEWFSFSELLLGTCDIVANNPESVATYNAEPVKKPRPLLSKRALQLKLRHEQDLQRLYALTKGKTAAK